MVTEIELKAHIRDSGTIKLLLSKKADYLGSFEKNDTYWLSAEIDCQGKNPRVPCLPHSGLRVRSERRVNCDGKEESATLATFKIKELRDGIEINNEHEFEVHPSKNHDISDFEEFLTRLGLKPGLTKRKHGWAFSYEGINAELLEVDGLGWFIELEIIKDNNREETFTEGKKKLLDFLDSLGIEREAIESRFYSEMLTAKF